MPSETRPADTRYVVTVEFTTAPEHFEQFKIALAANGAAAVKTEPGCLQFDIAQPEDGTSKVFVYEVYADKAAFKTHLGAPGFKSFMAEVKPLITDQKFVAYSSYAAHRKP